MGEKNRDNDKSCFIIDDCPRISGVIEARDLFLFFTFLQQGFFVEAPTGVSVKRMLSDRFGLDPEYIESRIKTVFFDGKPVDDMDKAVVRNGCTLALSAAMPGLVGATFRSGGVLSAFRATISHLPEACDNSGSGNGAVLLKLFNLLVPELGPVFLKNGVFVEKNSLCEFFKKLGDDEKKRLSSITLNDQPESVERLARPDIYGSQDFVFLRIESSEG